MTPKAFSQARAKLQLTMAELAPLLGYDGDLGRAQISLMESGERTIRPAQERLLQAYLDGYRPKDWPNPTERHDATE